MNHRHHNTRASNASWRIIINLKLRAINFFNEIIIERVWTELNVHRHKEIKWHSDLCRNIINHSMFSFKTCASPETFLSYVVVAFVLSSVAITLVSQSRDVICTRIQIYDNINTAAKSSDVLIFNSTHQWNIAWRFRVQTEWSVGRQCCRCTSLPSVLSYNSARGWK